MFENRSNLSEIHDQPWFPKNLRDGVTDALQFILNTAQIYRPVIARLQKAIEASGTHRLLDLCSGGGGPWIWLHPALGRGDSDQLEVCLTDKYPNVTAYKRVREISNYTIDYCAQSVNAIRIPQQLSGFRTLFTSFHHFSPNDAVALLQDAVDNRQGIGVFEVPRRHLFSILLTFLMPLAALLTVPLIRPFRFSRLLWTYVIPVIPFILLLDGILSCLRAYSPAELKGIILRVKASGYKWEVGEEIGWLSPVTYLLGYPDPQDERPAAFLRSIHGPPEAASTKFAQPQQEKSR